MKIKINLYIFLILSAMICAGYSDEEIKYFEEVALGTEFGENTPLIRKWDDDITIKVFGQPGQKDIETLRKVIADLQEIIDVPRISLADTGHYNLALHFEPGSKFKEIHPRSSPADSGFFWCSWHPNNVIYRSVILISKTGLTQKERDHIIREELTQSLGLMRDSSKYENSIFFSGWTDVIRYAPIDEVIIEMLYRPDIKAGMTRNEVVKILKTNE